jgi:predicted phage terminase large subunit-like protein
MTTSAAAAIERLGAAQLYRAARAEKSRRSLAEFVRQAWHVLEPNGRPFQSNPGTDAIIEHLQALGEGKIKRLGIACPPGFGKTTLCSVAYPAWMWARDPSWRSICASHAHELAKVIATKFSRVVLSDWYLDGFGVRLESDAITALTTMESGRRQAIGVGGALTGMRADGGIVDDSLNAIDAGSKQAVADVNEWFDVAFGTRFDGAENAPIVVVQQRLDANDLISHVQELGYEMLILPARFEAHRRCVTSIWQDPRTEDGDILAPGIHSEAWLEEQLRVLRPHGFATQYQQAPAPREGNQFKVGMWSYCSLREQAASALRPRGARTDPPHVLERRSDGSLDLDLLCVTADVTGGSLSTDASALGLLVYARKGQRRFVLSDFTPGPRTFLESVADIKQALRAAVEIAGPQRRVVVLVEKKALGQGAIEKLQKAIADGELVDRNGRPIVATVKAFEPSGRGDKAQRASAMEPDIDAGLLHLLDGASWVPAFVEEFALFPRGPRNDRVDALSQAELEFSTTLDTREEWRAMRRLAVAGARGR